MKECKDWQMPPFLLQSIIGYFQNSHFIDNEVRILLLDGPHFPTVM